jgi:hypothetical protein
MRCKYDDETGHMSSHNWDAMTYVKHERLPITIEDYGYLDGEMATYDRGKGRTSSPYAKDLDPRVGWAD